MYCDDAGQAIELAGATIRSAVDEFVDLEAILATQRARGIDHVLLCPWVALLDHWRVLNDGLARGCAPAAPTPSACSAPCPSRIPAAAGPSSSDSWPPALLPACR